MDTVEKIRQLLEISEMEPIAKRATFEILAKYTAPSEEQKSIVAIGKIITDMEGIFELYIPSDRPQDAIVISCAKVNRITGEVKVDVFLQPLK